MTQNSHWSTIFSNTCKTMNTCYGVDPTFIYMLCIQHIQSPHTFLAACYILHPTPLVYTHIELQLAVCNHNCFHAPMIRML